jgi:hypothetical protein
MSWSGGTYTKSNAGTGGWTGDAVAGIAIDATRHDTQDNDFATGINQCLTKDGQNSCTADLNFGGFRPSNVAGGSAAAPAYTANNDTDTGAFSPAANAYAIATGGVERIRIESTGNVAIGTTNTTNGNLTINGTAGKIALMNGGTFNGEVGLGVITGDGDAIGINARQAAGKVSIATANTERVRITSTGNVGIGTTTPAVSIQSSDDTDTSDRRIRAGTNARYVELIRNASTDNSVRSVGNADFIIDQNAAGNLIFRTNAIERGRFTSGGTAQFRGNNASSSFTSTLCSVQIAYVGGGTEYGIGLRPATDVTNAVQFQNAAGTAIGSISTTAAATAYNTTSDYRLKNNVQPFPDGLTKVKALSPSQWEWSADDSEGFGFIAHELQAVVPEAVTGAKDAVDANGDPIYQAVDYGKLTTVLVAAVKELTAKVESLEARIAVLEGA